MMGLKVVPIDDKEFTKQSTQLLPKQNGSISSGNVIKAGSSSNPEIDFDDENQKSEVFSAANTSFHTENENSKTDSVILLIVSALIN